MCASADQEWTIGVGSVLLEAHRSGGTEFCIRITIQKIRWYCWKHPAGCWIFVEFIVWTFHSDVFVDSSVIFVSRGDACGHHRCGGWIVGFPLFEWSGSPWSTQEVVRLCSRGLAAWASENRVVGFPNAEGEQSPPGAGWRYYLWSFCQGGWSSPKRWCDTGGAVIFVWLVFWEGSHMGDASLGFNTQDMGEIVSGLQDWTDFFQSIKFRQSFDGGCICRSFDDALMGMYMLCLKVPVPTVSIRRGTRHDLAITFVHVTYCSWHLFMGFCMFVLGSWDALTGILYCFSESTFLNQNNSFRFSVFCFFSARV